MKNRKGLEALLEIICDDTTNQLNLDPVNETTWRAVKAGQETLTPDQKLSFLFSKATRDAADAANAAQVINIRDYFNRIGTQDSDFQYGIEKAASTGGITFQLYKGMTTALTKLRAFVVLKPFLDGEWTLEMQVIGLAENAKLPVIIAIGGQKILDTVLQKGEVPGTYFAFTTFQPGIDFARLAGDDILVQTIAKVERANDDPGEIDVR